ncbi:MAG TPA: heparinase II/III family protein [Thermoguttaceae bacterium]|nr:heparinase II/III family protein [Thermoguttaceae bacterium]
MATNRVSTTSLRLVLLTALLATILSASHAPAQEAVDPARVQALAAMLPESPVGVGRPITDRQAWQAVARAPQFKRVVPEAERLMAQPIPEATDELYLDFSRTGNRTRYQRVLGQRHSRFPALVLAECIENRGRFLPAIEEAIRAVCEEKTWVYPAHDRSLGNFKGEVIEIDLGSAATSWNLATADYWLGEVLSQKTRDLVHSELERRCFGPFESYVNKGKPRLWWATGTNNWNAVCLAGVTGSALGAIESPPRRAFFVAAAEKYVQYFLKGFTPDGYCSEGLGYWNYGFGHYVLLAETIQQATGGRVDLFEEPSVRQIARFGVRMEILPGIYPAFADCHVASHPDTRLAAFLSRRFGWGLEEIEQRGLLLAGGPSSSLFELGIYGFENSASRVAAAEPSAPDQPLRDWFPDAGILICRPRPGNERGLGVALKGGHNAEHHNHNDVGSFVVALAGNTPLVDPGSEVYTARTFSGERYESGVLNSFGHPVPMVAGKLQAGGRSAAAKVLKAEFTDEQDTLVLDVSAAYKVEGLKKLQRSFIFSRAGAGRLVVIDEVELASPQSFATALVTFSDWKESGAGRLLVGNGSAAVQVEVDAGGEKFSVEALRIEEDLPDGRVPVRLGINLREPVTAATVTVTITPEAK